MGRIRTIKPQFFTSEDVTAQPVIARLLFAGLFTEADRDGRVEDRPRQIKTRLLPEDDCDVDALLWSLSDGRLIRRYEADGVAVIQILAFGKHQRPHPKEAASILPKDGTDRAKPCNYTAKNERVSVHPVEHPSSPAFKGREGDLLREGEETEPSPPLVFSAQPLIRKRNKNAEFEHPRFDVPTVWHIRIASSLAGGESRLVAFYRWLSDRVDRSNEDTVPRLPWLDRCLADWLASSKVTLSSVPGVEETKRMLAALPVPDPIFDGLTTAQKIAKARELREAEAS